MLLSEIAGVVTRQQLNDLERYLDEFFKTMDIDIVWSKHFVDRVNDPRNKKQITIEELKSLFKEIFKKHAKKIAQRGPDTQGVLNDISTKLNVPFVLKWDSENDELDLVSKTVMRKPNFQTRDKKFTVST